MERSVSVRTGQIGPAHDPYETETITVVHGSKVASMYRDGLGMVSLLLTDSDAMYTRKEKSVNPSRQIQTKFKILFRRHVGIAPRDAIDQYDREWGQFVAQCRVSRNQ